MAETALLGRRERQIMDVIYRRGRATAAEVLDGIPTAELFGRARDAPLARGERPRAHEQDGPRYVFLPIVNRDRARQSALKTSSHVLRRFRDRRRRRAARR